MADHWGEKRGSQFPTKFNTLPSINSRGSPQPSIDNQVIPYGAGRQDSPVRIGGQYPDSSSDAVKQLESRLAVTEKSNRALLEEVIRLQSEIKGTVRKNEDILREEKYSRQQFENSVRANNDLVAQLSTRLKRAEEKLADERSALSSLVNHTKAVEQAVIGSQQELVTRRDAQNLKIQEMKTELDETIRAKDQLERVCYDLADEVRSMKTKVDSTSSDLSGTLNELKNKSKRMEEENRQTLHSVRKHGETQQQAETSNSQLRNQVETRLSELRDVLVELRGKQDKEIQDRRMLENQVQARLSDMAGQLAEQNRRRDEAIHALDAVQREREHAAEIERQKLQGKIAEVAEEVSKKLLAKEIRLREETQDKFSTMEKLLANEQAERLRHEKEHREQNEQRWDGLKKLQDDQLQSMKDINKLEKQKQNNALNKLDESLSLMEQQTEGHRKQVEKVLTAEIKSRKHSQKDALEKIDNLEEKLAVAMSTLQQAVGGVNAQMNAQAEKIRKELGDLLEDNKQNGTRNLADMDARITACNQRLTNMEDRVDLKITTAIAGHANTTREKFDSLSMWQEITSQTIKDLQEQMKELPKEVTTMSDDMKKLKDEINKLISIESKCRDQDVELLKLEIEKAVLSLQNNDGASKSDIEMCQTSIRKLAESIQTVKTVLGMKIQSEQKLRDTSIWELKEELHDLNKEIEKLGGDQSPRHKTPPSKVQDDNDQPPDKNEDPTHNDTPNKNDEPPNKHDELPNKNDEPPGKTDDAPDENKSTDKPLDDDSDKNKDKPNDPKSDDKKSPHPWDDDDDDDDDDAKDNDKKEDPPKSPSKKDDTNDKKDDPKDNNDKDSNNDEDANNKDTEKDNDKDNKKDTDKDNKKDTDKNNKKDTDKGDDRGPGDARSPEW
ncbi:unnamed protein product [Owenia fusiformis]|uniref:Uncharacterized protein n=1 Tax=Owenia fusiformis TaxID=6347 RepID=A0A8J1U4W3_OWEFU|nr:unnamed protein product [Owenia fusiformis]